MLSRWDETSANEERRGDAMLVAGPEKQRGWALLKATVPLAQNIATV